MFPEVETITLPNGTPFIIPTGTVDVGVAASFVDANSGVIASVREYHLDEPRRETIVDREFVLQSGHGDSAEARRCAYTQFAYAEVGSDMFHSSLRGFR